TPTRKTLPSKLQMVPCWATAEFHRVVDQGFEYRLEIERRSADHLQHFSRGGLLFQRLPQAAIARLQLSEQAHILNSDYRLVRKSLEQGDLVSREAASFAASHPNRSDGHVVTEHRHDHPASEATDASEDPLAL